MDLKVGMWRMDYHFDFYNNNNNFFWQIYHASGIDVRYKNNDANPKWEPFRDIHHRNENTKKKEDEENPKWDPFGSSKHLEQQNSILSTSPYSRRRKTANPSSSLGTLEVSSIARLEQLLVKMRLWESALVNHFRGRTYPVNHPMWAKLKSVRLLLKLESSKVRFDVVHMCIYYLCSTSIVLSFQQGKKDLVTFERLNNQKSFILTFTIKLCKHLVV